MENKYRLELTLETDSFNRIIRVLAESGQFFNGETISEFDVKVFKGDQEISEEDWTDCVIDYIGG